MSDPRGSAAKVNQVVSALLRSPGEPKVAWLRAVAAKVTRDRPDLGEALVRALGAKPAEANLLQDLSVGELSVCYEALLAHTDRQARKNSGQYFTPDDAASFMAEQTASFPPGKWVDPACGVGNLSWHLAALQKDPSSFIRNRLVLIDKDEAALRTAVALIGAKYAGSETDLAGLESKATCEDFLAQPAGVSAQGSPWDYAIVNPPYAKDAPRKGYATGQTRDLFAYFLEKVMKTTKGFVAVTPASYLSARRYQVLRDLLAEQCRGGDVFVFDNVPDTLFRGYKFGSTNTSQTNFVRAAVTVCAPGQSHWRITPILRWQKKNRDGMFDGAPRLLSGLRKAPDGQWAKIHPNLVGIWETLKQEPVRLCDLMADSPTDHRLEVALTPRYYISASFRPLQRASKATLYFKTETDMLRVAAVLNSSIPYLWWRSLDGGVALTRRVLLTTPIPPASEKALEVARLLREKEEDHVVVKLNAGRRNENVKRPSKLVKSLDRLLLAEPDVDLACLYTNNMFSSSCH